MKRKILGISLIIVALVILVYGIVSYFIDDYGFVMFTHWTSGIVIPFGIFLILGLAEIVYKEIK